MKNKITHTQTGLHKCMKKSPIALHRTRFSQCQASSAALGSCSYTVYMYLWISEVKLKCSAATSEVLVATSGAAQLLTRVRLSSQPVCTLLPPLLFSFVFTIHFLFCCWPVRVPLTLAASFQRDTMETQTTDRFR